MNLVSRLKRLVHGLLRLAGYQLAPYNQENAPAAGQYPNDFSDADKDLMELVRPYTMTSPERVFSLARAVEYIVQNRLPGALVECGVWKGGSMLAAAKALKDLGEDQRELYLFDTFEGMTAPTEADLSHDGQAADQMLQASDRQDTNSVWCYADLDSVRATLALSGYDPVRLHFVVGPVETTIPAQAPDTIALLRLDTDWYESTKHELEHLFPRLVKGGVLIIDDYGFWRGSRQATDEYLAKHGICLLLNRIDDTARIGIKLS